MTLDELEIWLVEKTIYESGTVPMHFETAAPAIRRMFHKAVMDADPEAVAAVLVLVLAKEATAPCSNWRHVDCAVRHLAGCDVSAPLLKEPPEPTRGRWPQNVLRHTAATIAVALGKPIVQLTFEHGHTGGLEMLRRHYVGAMPKAEAIKIWRLGPNGRKLANLKIS